VADAPASAPRLLEAIYLTMGAAWLGLLVWNHLDPDGPADWFAGARERAREWRGYREAMNRTLADIGDLPETEPVE
jgi:hypothetical protein